MTTLEKIELALQEHSETTRLTWFEGCHSQDFLVCSIEQELWLDLLVTFHLYTTTMAPRFHGETKS